MAGGESLFQEDLRAAFVEFQDTAEQKARGELEVDEVDDFGRVDRQVICLVGGSAVTFRVSNAPTRC